MAKKKKHFYVDERHIDYIKEVKEEKFLKYDSEALDLIIREHKENEGMRKIQLVELIGEEFSAKLEPILKILKHIGNENNENLLVIMELFNNLCFRNDYKKLVSTEIEKHECLIEAENLVNKRIANKRNRRLEKVYD